MLSMCDRESIGLQDTVGTPRHRHEESNLKAGEQEKGKKGNKCANNWHYQEDERVQKGVDKQRNKQGSKHGSGAWKSPTS